MNKFEIMRRMGRENFERYFLHGDGDVHPEEIAAVCGIKPEEVPQILDLVNRVFLESEMSPPLSPPSAPQTRYTALARIILENQELSIAFFSPRMAQGGYQIDHSKLTEIRKKGLLSPEERKALNALLSKISLINLRKNSLYQVLVKLCEFQKRFFLDEQEENLAPLAQKKMAQELGLSASSVSRLIYGRSLQTPSGRETPLEAFFPSRKDWLKARVRGILREDKPLTDASLQNIIKKQYGITLSRRSVNQYRLEINRKVRRRK
jgi:AraC-like DNA-binding protein